MRMNLFVATGSKGHRAVAVQSVEDDLIEEIDEQSMSEDEILEKRFKFFLGENRLSLTTFELLPEEEKQRLRNEFLGG